MESQTHTVPRFFAAYAESAIQIKREANSNKDATIAIEMAPMAGGDADWSKKVHFQLKPDCELVKFSALMIGLVNELKFKNHGPDRNKSLTIKRNENNSLYVALSEGKGQSLMIVLQPESAWLIGTLAINQLRHRLTMSFGEATSMLRLIKYGKDGQ